MKSNSKNVHGLRGPCSDASIDVFPRTKSKISKSKTNPGIVSADNETMQNNCVGFFFWDSIPSCF